MARCKFLRPLPLCPTSARSGAWRQRSLLSAACVRVLAGDGHNSPGGWRLRQVKGMKEEKQDLLRQLEELRAENGNLQELVGFLTESADLAADQSGDYGGDYGGEQYGSDDDGMYGQAVQAQSEQGEAPPPEWE